MSGHRPRTYRCAIISHECYCIVCFTNAPGVACVSPSDRSATRHPEDERASGRLVRTGGEQQREQEAGGVGRLRAWFARRYPRRCTTRRIAGTARASAQCVRVRYVRPERGKKEGRMPFRRTLLVRPGGRWSSGGAACFGSGDDTTRHDTTRPYGGCSRAMGNTGSVRAARRSEPLREGPSETGRRRNTTVAGGRGIGGSGMKKAETGPDRQATSETRRDTTRLARTHARTQGDSLDKCRGSGCCCRTMPGPKNVVGGGGAGLRVRAPQAAACKVSWLSSKRLAFGQRPTVKRRERGEGWWRW